MEDWKRSKLRHKNMELDQPAQTPESTQAGPPPSEPAKRSESSPEARETEPLESTQRSATSENRAARPRWEDRYTRVTWYVENQRLQRVREMCQSSGKSLTNIVNEALEKYLHGHRLQ